MKKSSWFYLDPYVHIAIKQGHALVYNTLTGQALEEDSPVIVDLIKKLNTKKHLLVVELGEEELNNPEIAAFVGRVRSHFSGDLIDKSYSGGKPLLMRPQVKVQKDVEELKKGGEGYVGEEIMNYLTEISLYIDNSCTGECSSCAGGYRQFLSCTRGHTPEELEIEDIKRFLNEAQGSSLFKVTILGGDIFAYSKFTELVGYLNKYSKPKTFHSHYLHLEGREEEIGQIDRAFTSFSIQVDVPVKEDRLAGVAAMLARLGLSQDAHYLFVIQKEEEIDEVEAVASRLKLAQFTFKPFYNGNNLAFFKDNIFVNKAELLLLKPSLKQIFSRMKLNPLSFGKITVLSNRGIYANVNAKKIGVLGRDSLYDVVLREMFTGGSWRRSRERVSPCKSCVYCYLCPPLTGYEYSLKRNNLCNLVD